VDDELQRLDRQLWSHADVPARRSRQICKSRWT
jgi:hypothetical protein